MNNVQIIRDVLALHKIGSNGHDLTVKCSGCGWIGWHIDQHRAAMVDEALTAAQTITTVEQLEALNPADDVLNGAVVRVEETGELFEMQPHGGWVSLDEVYDGTGITLDQVPLPALLLWEPS